MARTEPDCWILTDGKAGDLSATRGLAAAIGLSTIEKTVDPNAPWRWLPPSLWPPGILGTAGLAAPWPALTISCGRKAVGPALEIKRRSRGATLAVHIQHPRVDPARFDLVAAPAHDRLKGPTVEVTLGSVHGVTRARLDAEAQHWRPALADLPTPRVAVLIGGSNKAYTLDRDAARRIADDLDRLAAETGCGLMITASRRTDPEAAAIIRDAVAGKAAVFWDGAGDNPLFGYLGLADRVIVTGDSVNMISEAAATGKPVQVIALPKTGRSAKFERFHQAMITAGAVRPFDGTLAEWDFHPPDDTVRVAERVKGLLADRGIAVPD